MKKNLVPKLYPLLAFALNGVLTLNPLTGQTVVNGNFDTQAPFGTFPGYASGNGGSITGWTLNPDTRVGLNISTDPFANNGAIPSSPNAAFIQAGGSGVASISQTVTDLTIGVKYNASFRVNARNQGGGDLPQLVFSTDATGPAVAAEISKVSTAVNATPFRTVAYEFTATATSHVVTIANVRTTGDHTLVVDDFVVTPSNEDWSFAPLTGDGDSGVDPSYVYTHAYNLGSATNVNINGVTFLGRNASSQGLYTLTSGLTGATAFGAGVNQVTGSTGTMVNSFRYDGDPSITLQNLKPSTEYVFTIYGAGWDLPGSANAYRSATFSSSLGGDQLTVNLNHYGQGQGMKINYTYTTDAIGSPVTIFYPRTSVNSGSFHTSGFSNREAVTGTPDVVWTQHLWTNDETSGVSPNHVYTHAFKFNSNQNFNINGINFTGLTGNNPSGANYTSSGQTAAYTGDLNAVTGYGAPLARDFIYGSLFNNPAVHTLSGLTPGKQYVATIYSVGWNDGLREGAFHGAAGEPMVILNQDVYGDNQGVRFECLYTANSTGTANITFYGRDNSRSIHTYGISNREADPVVGVAPLITLQPTGASVGTGNNFLMRVAATGSATLSYQWKRGATNVGLDSPVLFLENVDFADAGDYTVVVSNGVSSDATSSIATLVVLDNVPGVFGTGVGITGVPLPAGAIDPHYTLLVNPDDTESSVARVQGNIPGPWLANSGTSKWIGPRTDSAGSAAMLANDGEGAGTYVYRTQWDLTGFDLSTVQITGGWTSDNVGLALRVNGTATGITNTGNFGSLNTFVINITNAPTLTAGVNTIDFVVNNADPVAGFTGLRVNISSAIGLIPPNTPPHIAVQPTGGNALHNGTFTLAVGASGSAPLAYQWYRGVDALSGETGPTLVLNNITPATAAAVAGDYKVEVSNGVAPAVTSSVATITVTNALPVVVNDNLSTNEDTPLMFDSIFSMINNDTDADGDILALGTFAATSLNGGTVTLNEGIITYTPARDFSGIDSFTYTVTDGWGGTSVSGTLQITVNEVVDPPPGPMSLNVDLVGGNATGTFTGNPGATYILQRSTTLNNDWVNIDTEVAPLSGAVTVVDSDPPPGKAFYRICYAP
jgi:hypothetical protein